MAAAGVTTTGMREARASVERLPIAVQIALRNVARATAFRIQAGAQRRVPVLTGWTRDHITVTEQFNEQTFTVSAGTDSPQKGISLHTKKSTGRTWTQRVTLNMLPVWLEYGTGKMSARPFMRPASEAESDQYLINMREASYRTALGVLVG